MKSPVGTTDVLVLFSLPFPLHLPATIKEGQHASIRPEIYVAGEPPASVHHFLKGVQSADKIGSVLEVEGGDPFGRFSISEVQVRFNLEVSTKLVDALHSDLVMEAVKVINRLIAHYRDLAYQPLLRRVAAADLVHFRILYLKSGGVLHALQYATSHGPLLGRPVTEKEDLDAQIRGRLQRTDEPDLFREMELRMIQLFREKDYRATVIEAAVLFECWLKHFVRAQFASTGLSNEKIESKFRTKDGRFQSADYVARVLVLHATDLDFKRCAEYDLWRSEVANIRNELIHGSRLTATEDDASTSISTIYRARDVIIKSLKERQIHEMAGS